MDRKLQLENLKKKNQISNVCKEWKNNRVDISFENFIDISKTMDIQEAILKRMDIMDKEKETIIYPLNKDFIPKYTKLLNKRIKSDCLYFFFHRDSTQIGAIQLLGKNILDNFDFMLDESELRGGCSLFLSTIDCSMGCCIWLTEYDGRIYSW